MTRLPTSYDTGRRAEQAAAEYLQAQGYHVVARNWKTPRCEIDIVAHKDQTVYFIEVKYRVRDTQGSGLDYITPRKLRQMHFAAEMWVQKTGFAGDYSLGAIEVAGPTFTVTEYLTDL